MKKAAVVTITVGEAVPKYEKHFIPSIKAYADTWNFDFIQIKQLLKTPPELYSKHRILSEKLLILEYPWAEHYEYIIFIDADIIINYEKAPNILDGLEDGKIGVVDEFGFLGLHEYVIPKWNLVAPGSPSTPHAYYTAYNFPKVHSRVFNSGVVVYQPKHHKEFMKYVYDTYIDRILAGAYNDGDQAPLNYEANSRDIVQYIDQRWNRIWGFYWILLYGFLDRTNPAYRHLLQGALKNLFDISFGLHLAGRMGWEFLD
jgi:hypothetical protein